MIEAYPLYWPEDRKRTPTWSREKAKFDCTMARARDGVLYEIKLMGGKDPIISSNIELRRDGLPLANRKPVQDQGIAVYFTFRGKQVCFACDRWDKIEHNMRAIEKTIEALRGIARWGTGDMMEAAFRGFVALPDQTNGKNWRGVFGFAAHDSVTLDEVRARYRNLAAQAHPDRGGSSERMALINLAWQEAQAAL